MHFFRSQLIVWLITWLLRLVVWLCGIAHFESSLLTLWCKCRFLLIVVVIVLFHAYHERENPLCKYIYNSHKKRFNIKDNVVRYFCCCFCVAYLILQYFFYFDGSCRFYVKHVKYNSRQETGNQPHYNYIAHMLSCSLHEGNFFLFFLIFLLLLLYVVFFKRLFCFCYFFLLYLMLLLVPESQLFFIYWSKL